ncbi:MAG: host attachment protein [Sphingomonadales bacterium]|nr:host attachment protein [Sphingomonadales bacterium]
MLFNKEKTWIVVADGARAFIYENAGPGKGLSLLAETSSEDARKPTSEQGTDRPGQNGSAGSRRHGYENPADWHEAAKTEFVKGLSGLVNDAAGRGAFDKLILIAAPKALGDIRQNLGAKARDKVVHEMNKDLTQLKPDALCNQLKGVLKT